MNLKNRALIAVKKLVNGNRKQVKRLCDLPDKVVDIDIFKINRNMDKKCKCIEKRFTIDTQNRIIYCRVCGSQIDPYDAMYYLAAHSERMREQVARLLEQRKQIINYKPHMIVFRELEKGYRGKKMLPTCPHCKRGFYYEELTSFVNKELEEAWRKRDKKEGELKP